MTQVIPKFNSILMPSPTIVKKIFGLLCLIQVVACTPRDMRLENTLSAKLQQFKNSNESSMDLNEVLGNQWRRVCVQTPYGIKEDFNKNSGEKINRLLDISENELAIWVFYNDSSVRAAILKRNILDFGANKSKNGNQLICTTSKQPYLYISKYPRIAGIRPEDIRDIFFFKD